MRSVPGASGTMACVPLSQAGLAAPTHNGPPAHPSELAGGAPAPGASLECPPQTGSAPRVRRPLAERLLIYHEGCIMRG